MLVSVENPAIQPTALWFINTVGLKVHVYWIGWWSLKRVVHCVSMVAAKTQCAVGFLSFERKCPVASKHHEAIVLHHVINNSDLLLIICWGPRKKRASRRVTHGNQSKCLIFSRRFLPALGDCFNKTNQDVKNIPIITGNCLLQNKHIEVAKKSTLFFHEFFLRKKKGRFNKFPEGYKWFIQ